MGSEAIKISPCAPALLGQHMCQPAQPRHGALAGDLGDTDRKKVESFESEVEMFENI